MGNTICTKVPEEKPVVYKNNNEKGGINTNMSYNIMIQTVLKLKRSQK